MTKIKTDLDAVVMAVSVDQSKCTNVYVKVLMAVSSGYGLVLGQVALRERQKRIQQNMWVYKLCRESNYMTILIQDMI